jgi:hypothetical protein
MIKKIITPKKKYKRNSVQKEVAISCLGAVGRKSVSLALFTKNFAK